MSKCTRVKIMSLLPAIGSLALIAAMLALAAGCTHDRNPEGLENPGELTESQQAKVVELAVQSPEVSEWLQGRTDYRVGSIDWYAIVWEDGNPAQWWSLEHDRIVEEGVPDFVSPAASWYPGVTIAIGEGTITQMQIAVDLESGKVAMSSGAYPSLSSPDRFKDIPSPVPEESSSGTDEIQTSVSGTSEAATDSGAYHSEEAYLTVTLPDGWAAVEGPEYLARPFEGQVAFNNWGEEGFWAREVRTEHTGGTTSYSYRSQDVMSQIPEGGAYVVLMRIWGPPRPDDYEPTEYTLDDLGELCQPHDWRQDVTPDTQFGQFTFYKWGRDLRLEVYCHPDATDETVAELNNLLSSWRFDAVPVGDAEWMGIQARKLLPEEVESFRFNNRAGSIGNDEENRVTEVETGENVMIFRFIYEWDGSSHWWTVEVSPVGETTLTGEGGDLLPFD